MSSAIGPPERPRCPACGDRIGTYEPLWRVNADEPPQRVAWLSLDWPRPAGESLWHAACAERRTGPARSPRKSTDAAA